MGISAQQMTQLTLDVSKAHRRILVAPEDRGLSCFHAIGELYRCITAKFQQSRSVQEKRNLFFCRCAKVNLVSDMANPEMKCD